MEFSSAAAKSQVVGPLTGKTVGRFVVGERLGKGGMGEVYRAEDTRLKRTVALKRLAPSIAADPTYRHRFQEEAERASRFSDSHVAAVYDVIEQGEDTLLVMEFVEGQTLRQRLQGPMNLEQFLDVAVQCADALVAAHENGIVHCDIKPENIMLTSGGQVKILDFGVAKYLPRSDQSSTLDNSGTLSGTPAYMAPEVLLQKRADGRADIFSLSIVLYESLTGHHPFLSDSFVVTSQRILQESPAPIRIFNPSVPEALERVVGRAMAKDPAQRYASARNLAEDLRQIATEITPGKVLPKPSRRAIAGRRRKLVAVALTAAIVLILAVVLQSHKLGSWLLGNRTVSQIHLAVLPFTPGASDSNSKAFSDGLTETLAAKLTQLSSSYPLQIVPPSEIRAEGITTIEQARKGFGVTLVLVGALHQSGDRVRVTYSLVDAQAMRQISSDIFTADAGDVFAVEDRVVDNVVQMLGLELGQHSRASLTVHGTQEPAAHDYYLRGRGYLQDYHKPESLQAAISVFDRALAHDPNYALAYAGLGEAYWNKYEITGDHQWVDKAFVACQRAVELASGTADTRTCLGTIYNGTGQYEKAITEFQKAVEADVTSDDAVRGLAFAYEKMGRTSEAEKTFQQAIQIRPQYWAGYEALGSFYSSQARYEEAAQQFERAISLAPDDPHGYRSLGGIYIYMGRYAEAIEILRKAVELYPTTQAYSNLGVAYFNLRRFEDSIAAYQHACVEQTPDYIACGNLARSYYWAQNRRTQATEYYRRAIRLADERLRVNPRDGDPHILLSNYYAMLNDKPNAFKHLQEALALRPDDPEFLLIAAIVHNQFGEPSEAAWWAKKAIDRGYSAAEIRSAPELGNLRNQPELQKLLQSK
jgi:serine/threonine protein kinase/tetratricopeptide (TPR) repeat protein